MNASHQTVRPSIRAVQVSKWYGKVTALQSVSLELSPGVWGLLGPNGSGKTTFMRLCAGQTQPNLGTLHVCGERPFGNQQILGRVGLCPEADALYEDLTAHEFVSAMAELSGYPRPDARARAHAILKRFQLEQAMDRKLGGFSRGMRQRVKLAQALVHDPDVLLLDEPLSGTDPISQQVILNEVRASAERGALVLFSTHVLHEIEALTENVLLIARGQVVAQGNVGEIRELLDEHPHRIRVTCERARELAARLMNVEGILSIRFPEPNAVELETRAPDSTYAAICAELVRGNYTLYELTSPDATLEALFHYLVERSGRFAASGADAARGRAHVARQPGATS